MVINHTKYMKYYKTKSQLKFFAIRLYVINCFSRFK